MAERLRARASVARVPVDAATEATAARLLAAQRGRAQIQPAPSAGRIAAEVLRPILSEKTLGLSELKRRWREIAGEGVAAKAAPEKLAAGVLTLKVPSAAAPFLQHQLPLLLERLKLAGATIKSIRLEQGALAPTSRAARIARALSAAEENALAERYAGVKDEGLRAALTRLGRAVARR